MFSDGSAICRENDRIAKRVYVGVAGSRSLGKQRKRWIDTMNDYLKKRGLDIKASKKKNVSKWRGFVRGNALGVARGMTPRF